MRRNPDLELMSLFRSSYHDPAAARRFFTHLLRLNIDIGSWFATHFLQSFLINRSQVLEELLAKNIGIRLLCDYGPNFDDPEPNFQRWTEYQVFSLPGFPGEGEIPGMKTIKLRIQYECQRDPTGPGDYDLRDIPSEHPEIEVDQPHFPTVLLYLKAPLRIEYLIEDELDPQEESWRPPFDLETLEQMDWTDAAFVQRIGTLINHLIRAATLMEIGRRGYGLNLMATDLLNRFLIEKNQLLVDPPLTIPPDRRSQLESEATTEQGLLADYQQSLWREAHGTTIYRPQYDLDLQVAFRFNRGSAALSLQSTFGSLRDPIYFYLETYGRVKRKYNLTWEPGLRTRRLFSANLSANLEPNWTDEDFIRAFFDLVQQGIASVEN